MRSVRRVGNDRPEIAGWQSEAPVRYCRYMALPDGIDRDKLVEVALAMLHLTTHGGGYGTRAWKNMNWDLLDALHDRGWISDPKSKAKSVAFSDESERLAAEFFEKHFGRTTGNRR